MRCATCGQENGQADGFCGSCGATLISATSPNVLACMYCRAPLSQEERFCGGCGSPVATRQINDLRETDVDLFPLYGVTLGKTTVEELARLGKRTTSIDKNTGAPYTYYEIHETNFWYNESGVANYIYIARGVYPIPEPWDALGFDWNISYDQWLQLLRRFGYSITAEQPPRIVEYDGHDSFSPTIVAMQQAKPLIKLNFNYNQGTNADSKETLYSITLKAP